MKKMRKIALSGLALAATAATLGSTTFAWYTGNSEVKATTECTATTSDAGESTLLVSLTGKADSWGAKANLGTITKTLEPVSVNADGTFDNWDQTNNKEADSKNTANYVEFDLYFKGASSTDLSVSLATFNLSRTGDLTKKVKAVSDGNPTANADGQYTVDIMRSVAVRTTISTVAEAEKTAATSPEHTAGAEVIEYNTRALATGDDASTGTWNAHSYYNAIKGLEYDKDSPAGPTNGINTEKDMTATTACKFDKDGACTGWTMGTCNSTDVLKVTFTIYLDGWSKYCFDAVKGQTVSLTELKFQCA